MEHSSCFNLYAIYDSIACDMSQPFFARNDEHAMRMYVDAVQKSPYKKDLWLLRLGKIDTYKGIIYDTESKRVNVEIDWNTPPEVNANG